MEPLTEKLVSYVATKNKITKPQAVKFIDKCLLGISAEENIDYKDVYRAFYTYTGLTNCLAKTCTDAELKECEKLCHCVIFKGKCMSRYIPYAADINRDPDKWVKGKSTEELQELVKYASYLYYNYDGGGLTDNSFDALEYHLNKRLKLKGRRWEKIGAEPVEKLRTNLPYPMPSLNKLRPGMMGLINFLGGSISTGLVISDKLDGVSGLVVFKNGTVEGIYTRGNGEIGGDVTYLKDYIKLPQPTSHKYLVVRGEFVLSRKVWEEKYKGSYANARSFVSAKINSGYISPALPDIEFVAYQIVDSGSKKPVSPSQAFKILRDVGFKVAFNEGVKASQKTLVFDIITAYKKRREESEYDIDGLVLTRDIAVNVDKLANPEHSVAFKMDLEEQLRDTRVIDVDWNITRYGRYFPVAVFNSVYIQGVRIHRASAHNALHVSDWSMGSGTEITVTRSGDVIPTIKDVRVDMNIEPILPDNTYDWSWSGRDIILDDIESNPEVHIKRIAHFFGVIKTPQLGEGRVRKLYEAGMVTVKDVTCASVSDFRRIKGFGAKLSQNLYDNIHNTLRKTRLDRYFVAVTKENSKIGRRTLKTVTRSYPGILTASTEEIYAHFADKKNKIPGIGAVKIKGLAEDIPKFRKELLKLDKSDVAYSFKYEENRIKQLEKTGHNPRIKGGIFVFTGFFDNPDYDLEDYIWDNWGDISSTVTSDTVAVISANIANITGKMLKANELGVNVYSVEEFLEEFNVPIRSSSITDIMIVEDSF